MDRNDLPGNDPLGDQSLNRNTTSGAPDSTSRGETNASYGTSGTSDSLRGDSLRVNTTADTADLRRDTDVNPGDEIGEAVGGISGVLTGAAIGSLGGPIGTIIGGIAGAVSGWWAGRAISEAASHVTHDDEAYYRTHYEGSTHRLADRTYEDVRPAYQLGHLAGRNPDYQGRNFDEVETDLRRGWNADVSARHGEWERVRPFARDAYERGRSTYGSSTTTGYGTGAASTGLGDVSGASGGMNAASGAGASMTGGSMGTGSTSGSGLGSAAGAGLRGAAGSAADRLDDLKDRVDGNPASRPGPDATDRPGYGTAGTGLGAGTMGAGSMVDRGENALERGAHRTADAIDDLKDRVDGNPASRPGPDATDRPAYGAGGTGLGVTGTTAGMGSAGYGSTVDRVDNTLDRAGNRVENAADRTGNAIENAWDKTKNAVRNAADKVEDKLDDTKDRVDGNPASRPGLDRTDDPDRRF